MLEKGAWEWHISENLLFVDDGNLLKFCQSGQLCDFNESNKSKWHFSIVWLNLFLQTMLIDYGWIGLLVVCPMLMTQEWRFLTLWVQLVLAMMIVYHWKELITCNSEQAAGTLGRFTGRKKIPHWRDTLMNNYWRENCPFKVRPQTHSSDGVNIKAMNHSDGVKNWDLKKS